MSRPFRRTPMRLLVVVATAAAIVYAGVASADPPASFSVSGSQTVLQSVTFTTTGTACDGDVTCSWSFGDGGLGSGPSVAHTYLLPATYTVTLTVSDPADGSGPDEVGSQPVTIAPLPPPPNVPPSVEVDPPSGTIRRTGSTFSMTASDTDGSIVAREWRIDGGGFASGGATFTPAFASSGTHTVTARVTDNDGAQDTDSATVTVVNRTPTISAGASTTTAHKGDTVTFSATAHDGDGDATIAGIAWSGGGAGASTTRAYATIGTKSVTATVTDDEGADASDAASVQIVNQDPTISSVTGAATTNIGVATTFTMAASDPDPGDTLTRSWRVDDGSFVSGGVNFSPTFATAGTHTVTARVSDGDGGVDTKQASVTVQNQPPTVDFSWSPKAVGKGDLVTFTSDSADPDGKPLSKLEWDLDGDGDFDDGFGDTATRTYTTSGSRTISLRVTDADGGVAVGRLVLVPGNRPPTASFTAAPTSPLVGQTVTFTSTSKDSDGRVASLAWDLDGDNVFNEGTGGTASRTFTAVGTRRVGLKVTDDDGSTDVKFIDVVVQPSSGVAGASSVSSLRILRPFPKVRFAGALTNLGARIKLLSISAPKGAKISITCKKGCPRSKLARLARNVRLKSMQGSYRAGAVLVITVTKSNAIGKYTRITIVKGKAPKRIDRCLWPKSKKPRACPPGVGLT